MNAKRSDSGEKLTRFETTAVYTPSIIAKFMVNQIRHLIETWKGDLRNLKILEPSCGPGAFLVILYHILKEEYSKRKAQSTSDLLDAEPYAQEYSPQDDPLRHNLYGVDINPEAIALAKLNLRKQKSSSDPNLEVLERDTLARRSSVSVDADELSLNQDQIPHLRVGDFLFDDSANVPLSFSWAKEFPEVFQRNSPGFDIIIGNPPYSVDRNLPPTYREAIENRYGQYYHRQLDLYIPFVPRALELVRKNGLICYIIQHSLLAAKVTLPLREYLLENSKIHLIVDFGRFRRKVFNQSKVQVLPTIIVFERSPPPEDWQVHCVLTTQDPIAEGGLSEGLKESYLPQQYYTSKPLKPILTSDIRSIEEKINANCIELGQIYDVSYGLSLRPLRHLLYDQKVKDWENRCFLHTRGDFVRPYSDRRPFTFQYYLLLDIDQYPAAIGKTVRKGQGGAKSDHFIHPHLLIRRVCMDRVEATYFSGDPMVVANDSVLVATPRHLIDARTNKKDVKQRKKSLTETNKPINLPKIPFEEYSPHFILALINSASIRWLYQQTMSVDLAIYPRFVKQFPIPSPRTAS
ncbi:MAG: HsdM family class I SAM-dependent methyltransferase, partial [Candidatus Hodarchaeales archaeon]